MMNETTPKPATGLIYQPRGQAGEYAALATNPYRGCGHGCAYCYVPAVLRMDRREFDAGATLRPGYLQGLIKQAPKFRHGPQVMLSFTTDPYHPGDTAATTATLKILAHNQVPFCTLTKGGTRALRDLALFRPAQDAFASTLTSLDPAFSAKWERGAAPPADRLEALRTFHRAGIFTWVSLEPTLDTEASLALIQETHEYVDLYKIGRANYLPMTKTTDWQAYTHRILNLVNRLGVKHYIKRDLQQYLPDGYHNPLRVPQHHGHTPRPILAGDHLATPPALAL